MFRLNREYKKRLVKVMRLKAGDPLLVLTPGKKWDCKVQQILPDEITLEVVRENDAPAPSLHLILGQAIPKGDRFEWLIQKATELGVAEIYPLITERTIVKPGQDSAKIQRWNEIAEHAAGQSENSLPATVHAPMNLQNFLDAPTHADLRLLLHERKEGVSLQESLRTQNNLHRIMFIVGPEGGWTESETERFLEAGYHLIHLGPRVLRAETSGLVVATLLQYELGDFRGTKQDQT